jgi:hypothetical protein
VAQIFDSGFSRLISEYFIKVFNLNNREFSVSDLKSLFFESTLLPNVVLISEKKYFFEGFPILRSSVLLIRVAINPEK